MRAGAERVTRPFACAASQRQPRTCSGKTPTWPKSVQLNSNCIPSRKTGQVVGNERRNDHVLPPSRVKLASAAAQRDGVNVGAHTAWPQGRSKRYGPNCSSLRPFPASTNTPSTARRRTRNLRPSSPFRRVSGSTSRYLRAPLTPIASALSLTAQKYSPAKSPSAFRLRWWDSLRRSGWACASRVRASC